MLHRQFVLDPDADYPLFITAKQYWCPEFEANWDIPEAFTLVVLHSTSFHKETWEPTLQELFDGVKKHAPNTFKIKSAWVIECPNHGQTAALNDAALQRPPFYRACE